MLRRRISFQHIYILKKTKTFKENTVKCRKILQIFLGNNLTRSFFNQKIYKHETVYEPYQTKPFKIACCTLQLISTIVLSFFRLMNDSVALIWLKKNCCVFLHLTVFLCEIHILLRDDCKIIRELVIILAIFPWFDCHFLSPDTCYKHSLKFKDHDLTNIFFIKLH